MTQAERAGGSVAQNGRAGLPVTAMAIARVFLRRFNQDITVKALVLVGADGSNLRSANGQAAHPHQDHRAGSCLQFIVDQVETEGCWRSSPGHEWAPGGYAWVFPKLGTVTPRSSYGRHSHHDRQNAQWHLDRFIHHSFFKNVLNSRILEIQGVPASLCAPSMPTISSWWAMPPATSIRSPGRHTA